MIRDIREFKRLLEEIRWLDAQLCGKNFFLTWQRSLKEVQQVLYTAEALKWLHENNISAKCFESGLAVLQIREQTSLEDVPGNTRVKWPIWTTWNRLSFVSAANLLGLAMLQVDQEEGEIQPVDLSLLAGAEIIGIQDTRPGAGEDKEGAGEEKEDSQSPGNEDETGSLNRLPGIIHLLTHLDHPSRGMADLLRLKHHFGSLERLPAKKIAVTWSHSRSDSPASTPVGLPITPPAVPQGVVALATRFGMDVTLAYPEGYDLNAGVMEVAHQHARDSGGRFTILPSMDQALADAEAVYLVNWSPATAGEKRPDPGDWQYGPEQAKLTREDSALTLGCEAALAYHSHLIAALVVNNRFKEPAKLLENLRKGNSKRQIYPV